MTRGRRVMVVEDSEALRTLTLVALESKGYEVIGVRTPEEAVRLLVDWDPDAALLDFDLGVRPNGVELARLLLAKSPYLAVVFLTGFANPPGLRELAEQHSIGFLVKSELTSMEKLDAVLDRTLRGEEVLGVELAVGGMVLRLTRVQLDVLRLVAAGWSNQRIAESRHCTIRSVERILDRIYAELGIVIVDSSSNPRILAAHVYIKEFGFVDGNVDPFTET